MEKLDRLGWAAGLTFVAHGVRVGIRTTDPGVLDRAASCLPFGAKPSQKECVDLLYSINVGRQRGNVKYFHMLYANDLRMVRTLYLESIFSALRHELEACVLERARRRVFLHAGVVGWQGQAIVVPGKTWAGKTTLIVALVRAGATYYSDEYAALDLQGRVHPHPRPLSIRKENGETSETPIETLGGRTGRGPLPVGTVLMTHYRPGRVWRPRQLSIGRAALQLMHYTYSARLAPERTMAVLLQVAERARTLTGVRGEAHELVNTLLDNG